MNEVCRGHKRKVTHQAFLLFPFSFSFLLMAFFNLPSSSLSFTPSILASALAHFSLSSIAFLFSSGNATIFSLRTVSWSSAWDGLEDVLSCCIFFVEDEEEPTRAEKATLVCEAGIFDVDGWSGTSSCVCKEWHQNHFHIRQAKCAQEEKHVHLSDVPASSNLSPYPSLSSPSPLPLSESFLSSLSFSSPS